MKNMRCAWILVLLVFFFFETKAQDDVVIGTTYQLNLQRKNNHSDAFMLHNAEYDSGDDILKWKSTHASFGMRGIRFSYSSAKGIYFYADDRASTASTTFTPYTRFFIGNNGKLGVGTTTPLTKFEIMDADAGGIPNTAVPERGLLVSAALTGGALYMGIDGTGNFYSWIQSRHKVNNTSYYPLALNPSGGNIGIGTAVPKTKLDVGGELRLDVTSAFPAEGAIGEGTWGNYILGNISNGQFLRMGVSNDNYTRAEILFDNNNRADGTISFKTTTSTGGALTRMFVKGSGEVGIGTTSPAAKLHVSGGNIQVSSGHLILDYSGPTIYTGTGGTELNRYLQLINSTTLTSASGLKAGGVLVADSYSYANPGKNDLIVKGNVGIGTNSPDEKLTVNGVIHTEEVRVDMTVPGPDYVFAPDYNLLPLSEVESYIKANKHLPEVPSAKQMEEEGLNLKEMNLLLLKKVEELTLHLIDKDKELEMLKARVKKIETTLEK